MMQEKRRRAQFPAWLRTRVNTGGNRRDVTSLLERRKLHTVCRSAKCPNLAECWHSRTATFMILGNQCTRHCTFCAVGAETPQPPDLDEPEQIALAAAELQLRFVVLTSVTRDDLPDHGSVHFAETLGALRRLLPGCGVEVLTPDFGGQRKWVARVLEAAPTVFNHNIETSRRLTPEIRSGAEYERSLHVLRWARELGDGRTATKSGMMLGLGETDDEVEETMTDLLANGVQILTLGQYLPPSDLHRPLDRYVHPEMFERFAGLAMTLGFKAVSSTPMTRSSYRAEELAAQTLSNIDKRVLAGHIELERFEDPARTSVT